VTPYAFLGRLAVAPRMALTLEPWLAPIGVIAEELETTPDGYATYRIAPGADFSKLYSVSLLVGPEGASR